MIAGAQACAAEAANWELSLRQLGTPARAAGEKAYLKLDMPFAGVPVPAVRSLVASWRRAHRDAGHDEITSLAGELWNRPLYECRLAAVILLERSARMLDAGDIGMIEHLLRTARTWALVDVLAASVAGDLAERYPEIGEVLDRWAGDGDLWLRRSALLALLGPLRRGGGDFERFGRYADAMLGEREFFIRKAIGWVLRDTARRRPAMVAAWLGPRVQLASGVTVREAVKPLPAAQRDALLAGYRDKRPVRCEHERAATDAAAADRARDRHLRD